MIYLINRETKEHRVYKSGDVVDYRIWKVDKADADGWIDWEGESDSSPMPCATLCRIKLSDGCELETVGPEEWSWSRGGDQHIIAYRPILEEPEAPEWDGEGLPPVGCECELLRGKEWVPVEITGKGKRVTVFRRLCNYGLEEITEADVTEFRPIRSEEEVVVRAMADVYRKAPHLTIYESIKCVYAAIRDGEVPGVRLTGNPRR